MHREGNLMKLRETVESCILQKFWIQYLRVCGWGLTSANSISHFVTILTLFRMGFFGAAHGCGRGQKGPLSKICHTYPKMMKLGTVIPYLKKVYKIYESRDTPLELCWHQHFFTGHQQILPYQEYRYRFNFDG